VNSAHTGEPGAPGLNPARTFESGTAGVTSAPRLPVIDLTAFSQGPQQRASTGAAVEHALTQSGFMYVSGHGVDAALLEPAFATMRQFFGQGPDFKNGYAYTDINANFGYQGRTS
jgi:isopenicillin N synthase-like dioxygenase